MMNTVQASIRQATTTLSARQASVLLTIVALLLWSYSITQAEFEIGFYGLIHSFPVTYFVALGILTIASAILWVSKENHARLLFLQLCILITSIWLAPVMVGGAHHTGYTPYSDLGFIEYITREGHFNQEEVWQHNWPTAWSFWAITLQTVGISIDDFANFVIWLPFIWQFLIFFPLFIFFRNTIRNGKYNYCWAGIWLFYLGEWFSLFNTGAQGFGVFIVVSILAMLSRTSFWEHGVGAVEHRISSTTLFACSAITHLLGSLVGLATIAAIDVTKRLKVSYTTVMAAVFIAAWSIYGAWAYFQGSLPDLIEAAFRIDIATEVGVSGTVVSGSESHQAVAISRIVFCVFFLAMAVVGGFLGWRSKERSSTDTMVLAITIGYGITAFVVAAGYGVELYQRFFLFLLPAMAYFIVKLLYFRATAIILCILLVFALPWSFISQYGNQKIDYLTPAYLTGADFFHSNTTNGHVTGHSPIGRMQNYENYTTWHTFERLRWEDNRLVYGDAEERYEISPHYIWISNHDRAMYSFYHGK
ncbi:MAG: hypothetical protein SVO26_00845, partial [Chloroflexota bacterium]|nr:hypothetical protein [Chloroflexota bacterium]